MQGEKSEVAHGHYKKNVVHLSTIDVYRVLELFGVTHPALQHAVKKLLVAGGRGAKPVAQDVKEAIDSLNRWSQMQAEDAQVQIEGRRWPELQEAARAAPAHKSGAEAW